MLSRTHRILHLAVAVMVFSAAWPLEAAVQAQLDRNRITEGETVTLTIRTDNPRQNLESDFSALEKNFEILDRRSETQLSIVSGQQTAVVRLLLTLEPRAAGKVVIPELVFGQDRTQPITVRVDPAPELEPGAQPPVFIEVEVMPEEGPYFVHAQLGLIVRVFYRQNLTEAAISQPEPSPAAVRLMQETPYQAERGGERYRVLERNYAVFPERSGELAIPPMQLTGRLVERRSSSVWQPAVRGRRIQVESDALNLPIDPRPAGFTGSEWQPARDYRLTQQVSSGDSLHVGEPVTRTVMVDAVGLEENMIAEPAWPDLPGVRIYPDQPQGITRDDGQWVLGHKEFRYAVVPEQEGELILPELRVHWWDTQNNRGRTAVLDSYTIEVLPSPLAPPTPAAVEAPGTGSVAKASDSSPRGGAGPAYWRWLTFLFAALWLATVAAWAARNGTGKRENTARPGGRAPENESEALAGLQKACKAGNPSRARKALQLWLRAWGPAGGDGSLLQFAAMVGEAGLRQEIYNLDASGFLPGSRPADDDGWEGAAFWRQFSEWREKSRREVGANHPPMTDLYAAENRVSPS